ncbi:hypothetical protein ACFX5Q_31885 [Mesorhizobium sp. IMUNJ 23033]
MIDGVKDNAEIQAEQAAGWVPGKAAFAAMLQARPARLNAGGFMAWS